jgi:hypothetical protein
MDMYMDMDMDADVDMAVDVAVDVAVDLGVDLNMKNYMNMDKEMDSYDLASLPFFHDVSPHQHSGRVFSEFRFYGIPYVFLNSVYSV